MEALLTEVDPVTPEGVAAITLREAVEVGADPEELPGVDTEEQETGRDTTKRGRLLMER